VDDEGINDWAIRESYSFRCPVCRHKVYEDQDCACKPCDLCERLYAPGDLDEDVLSPQENGACAYCIENKLSCRECTEIVNDPSLIEDDVCASCWRKIDEEELS
jgi:hypothetical protein